MNISLVHRFKATLETLDLVAADSLFTQALTSYSTLEVVEKIVVPALEQLGKDWEDGSVALSQIYMSGRFCEQLVERALPAAAPNRIHQPVHAIVVLDDYHLLGMRIVYSIMRASGFEILNYGRMDMDELVLQIEKDQPRILLISVLMMPSALKIRELKATLAAKHISLKILVGGAPFLFDTQLWQEVGADAMGKSAADAVHIVQDWIEEMS